jgi:hypothetical protein
MEHITSPPTFATSYIPAQPTPETAWHSQRWRVGDGRTQQPVGYDERQGWAELRSAFDIDGLGSTGKGILIGMLSAFGSAALVGIIIATVYFFRFTNRGRIFLDRIGRPGEYDDEQQFLREEEDAVAEMDEMQRAEYARAKGG